MEEKKTNLMPIVIIEFIIIIALIGLLFYSMKTNQNKHDEGPAPVKEPAPEKDKKQEKSSNPAKEQDKQEPDKPNDQKEEQDKSANQPNDSEKEKQTMITEFKKYYIKAGFADEKNIQSWEFKSVSKVNNPNRQDYYKFEGTFSCKDKGYECLYISQVDDPIDGKYTYPFTFYVKVKENNGNYTFSDVSDYLG